MNRYASENNVSDEIPERNARMTIRAVVFDIGGVLEITPRTGWVEKWEARLHLKPGELDERLMDVWREGSSGTISEEEVGQSVGELMGMDQGQVEALMADLWEEYLGELNVELAAYFASLRPCYQTAIHSNSFVGARGKEQERYHFAEMCDLIIYSHEEGMAKPERRIYELTCERLGVQPTEIIFLDDVEPNVAAAREFGIQAILFRETNEAIADIQACLQASSPAVTCSARYPASGDENALEGENCGSIDSSSSAGS
jgi:epoxide hydrolase-like predicted phosphatase